MPNLQELEQAKAIIESFAPKRQPVTGDKPMRIGVRQVPIYVIPVRYVDNEQSVKVRCV